MASKTGRMAPCGSVIRVSEERERQGGDRAGGRRTTTHAWIAEDVLDVVSKHHLVEDLASRLADKGVVPLLRGAGRAAGARGVGGVLRGLLEALGRLGAADNGEIGRSRSDRQLSCSSSARCERQADGATRKVGAESGRSVKAKATRLDRLWRARPETRSGRQERSTHAREAAWAECLLLLEMSLDWAVATRRLFASGVMAKDEPLDGGMLP